MKIETKVLILGGVRYVGLECCVQLLKEGLHVATLSRTKQEKLSPKHDHFVCDRKDFNALYEVIQQTRPDVILDMICFDVLDAKTITDCFRNFTFNYAPHCIVVSSFYVYNYHCEYSNAYEDDIENVLDGYTRRKIEAETELMNGMNQDGLSIVRLPFVFSHDDYTGRFQKLCQSAKLPTIVSKQHKHTMISKASAAMCLSEIVKNPCQGFLDISNTGCMTLSEMKSIIQNSNPIPPLPATPSDDPIYKTDRDICPPISSRFIDALPTLRDELEKESRTYFGYTKC